VHEGGEKIVRRLRLLPGVEWKEKRGLGGEERKVRRGRRKRRRKR